MTGYTWSLGRVVLGVQLVDMRYHQFDENDYVGHVYMGEPPQTPALIDGQIIDAGDAVRAELEAEHYAADKAANLKTWIYEDAFMILCQRFFGSTEKRGTMDLLAKAKDLLAQGLVTEAQLMELFGLVISIDKELTRLNGVMWWDSIVFHDDQDAIAGALQIVGAEA